MKPLNQEERRRTFLNFLLFFIITTAVVVTLVLFSVQVPFKENERWRRQIAQMDNEYTFRQSFNAKMEYAMRLLDSMSTTQNDPLSDTKIANKLNEMANMAMNDSVSLRQFYNNVINNLQGLQRAKQTLRSAYANSDDANETQRKMQDLQIQLTQCQNNYNQLMQKLQQ